MQIRSATVGAVCIIGLVGFVTGVSLQDAYLSDTPVDNAIYIAHALGGIDGETYTNSKEAFALSYKQGKRLFEADLMLHEGGEILVFHGTYTTEAFGIEEVSWHMPFEEFMSNKYKGKYTVLNFNDLITLLQKHPDTQLILDIKSDYQKTMRAVIRALNAKDQSLFSRIIPQVYSPANFAILNSMYFFSDVIYAPHMPNEQKLSPEELLEFVGLNYQITGVSLSEANFSDDLAHALRKKKREVLVHTVNDPEAIESYLERGATGFFTDTFVPEY